jgi:hypothetical protein
MFEMAFHYGKKTRAFYLRFIQASNILLSNFTIQ